MNSAEIPRTKLTAAETRRDRVARRKREHAIDQCNYQVLLLAARTMPGELDDVGQETIDGCRKALKCASVVLACIEARMLEGQS